MKTIIRDIRLGIDVRKNTVKLKNWMMEDPSVKIDQSIVMLLLQDTDWKVRKHACSIIALLKDETYLDELIQCFHKENNYIVKVEMIDTLTRFPITRIETFLMETFDCLKNIQDETNDKHIQAMLSKIVDCLAANQKTPIPVFTGIKNETSVVMTCLKSNQEELFNRVEEPKKKVGLGVMVKTENLKDLTKYREVEDYLFLITNFKEVDFDYQSIANALAASNLLTLLDSMHESVPYYLFRIDTSYIDPVKLKNEFVQKLAFACQAKLNHRLFNSASHYSIELQLREMKNNKVRVFLKLYTFEDPRFRYRAEITSNSLSPYVAASIIQLARPYLKEKADVLDLCCGTGTLLIERCFELRSHFMIGVDLYGKAIEAAKKNTSITRMDIHYVNRNYADFTHDHQFDEILSDLPVASQKVTYQMLEASYHQFLRSAARLLKREGYLILYSTEAKTLRHALKDHRDHFQFTEEYPIALKNTEAILFILQRI